MSVFHRKFMYKEHIQHTLLFPVFPISGMQIGVSPHPGIPGNRAIGLPRPFAVQRSPLRGSGFRGGLAHKNRRGERLGDGLK
ncbi:hypothetical protein JTE90_003494 [Oedothorax gibbosus]|uniref:Uncharacterized protein n=1 Tax=Oedothorax gibbosus TaxID=931172 RepID=A0AAV6UHR1_9ARAC|nr:hypothetical protein JTE90_003494 [Oedothorax gibbosus]